MPTSDAQKKASKKWTEKMLKNGSIKQFKVQIKSEVYQMIDSYCKTTNISKAQFLKDAAVEYISQHPVEQEIIKE